MALCLGNIFSYIISPNYRLSLFLQSKYDSRQTHFYSDSENLPILILSRDNTWSGRCRIQKRIVGETGATLVFRHRRRKTKLQ